MLTIALKFFINTHSWGPLLFDMAPYFLVSAYEWCVVTQVGLSMADHIEKLHSNIMI